MHADFINNININMSPFKSHEVPLIFHVQFTITSTVLSFSRLSVQLTLLFKEAETVTLSYPEKNLQAQTLAPKLLIGGLHLNLAGHLVTFIPITK